MKREDLITLIEQTVPPGGEIRIENFNIYDDKTGISMWIGISIPTQPEHISNLLSQPYIYPMTLDEIALKTGTDKSSKWHNYTKYYQTFFEPIRQQPIKFLEIGIWCGESLRLWKEYFPNGDINAIDIENKSQYNEERIKTFICDQSNKSALLSYVSDQTFDIILDDGSHQSSHQILSFETLFPYVNSGGFYVIEDCLTGYNNDFCPSGTISVIDRIKKMVDEVNMSGKIIDLRSDKVESLKKYQGTYFESKIEWMFSSCGLTIIKKL